VAEILPTHTPALFAAAVERAAEALRRGELVGLPTETVYGLAANALDREAVARIYALKGRPAENPIIVHVASRGMARELADEWPALADRLADEFWPGPLTLVVRRSAAIPDVVTAGGDTVGLRWPMHPLMPAVIHLTGFPLAAPSANLANQLSPTCAAHVASQLGDRLALIIDGGDCNVGIESTVVDVTRGSPVILRPGMISEAAIQAAAARLDSGPVLPPSAVDREEAPSRSGVLRSPGMLARHYAPRGRLIVWSWTDETELHQRLTKAGIPPETARVIAYRQIPLSGRLPHIHVVPDDAEAYARALYGQLHACDDDGAEWIIVEEPPSSPQWEGIRDRLRRASTP
jgi:L-threonylcarbamoyladenylate synthase